MKICKKCNSKYEAGSFCPACGNKLEDEGDGLQNQKDIYDLPPEYTEKPSVKPFIIMGAIVLVVFLGVGVVFLQRVKNMKPDPGQETVVTTIDNSTEETAGAEDGQTPVEEVVDEQTAEEKEAEEKAKAEAEKAKAEAEKAEAEKAKAEKAKKKTSTYKYVKKDVSWKEAKKEAKEAGGHLATITSKSEYKKVAKVASDSGLTFLWLGARVESDESWYDAQWITGEDMSYTKWYPGEPSYEDADGTEELYLCFWNVKYDGDNIGWTFNDQRNDIAGSFKEFRGKVGYIIEFEE